MDGTIFGDEGGKWFIPENTGNATDISHPPPTHVVKFSWFHFLIENVVMMRVQTPLQPCLFSKPWFSLCGCGCFWLSGGVTGHMRLEPDGAANCVGMCLGDATYHYSFARMSLFQKRQWFWFWFGMMPAPPSRHATTPRKSGCLLVFSPTGAG